LDIIASVAISAGIDLSKIVKMATERAIEIEKNKANAEAKKY
jgi:hypothetical protein